MGLLDKLKTKWNQLQQRQLKKRKSQFLYNYALWTHNRRINAQTRSGNPLVLELYNIILTNEYSDSDYWDDAGNYLLMQKLLNFDQADRQALEADLPNWTPLQLEIFTNSILPLPDDEQEQIIGYRSYLYTFILTIIDDDHLPYIVEEIVFINMGDTKPLALLQKLQSRLENSNYSNLLHHVHEAIKRSGV